MRRHLHGNPLGSNAVTHQPPWREFVLTHTPSFPDAPCAGHPNPDMWFAIDIKDAELADEAIGICTGCRHRGACSQYAVDNRIWDGIWGGLRPEQRKAIR